MIRPQSTRVLNPCKQCFGGKHHRRRVIYRSAGFLILVATYMIVTKARKFTNDSSKGIYGNTDKSALNGHEMRFLESDTDPECEDLDVDLTIIVLSVAGILYMFVAIAIVCDEFFVPALEEIASENHLNLSMDVAGATLMAAGGSAPELFTSLIGTFKRSQVGFGTIVGSAVFNVLFVIGMCAVFSKDVLTLTWWPLARDCTYYAIGLLVLAMFCGISSPGEIETWEALVLLALYIGYVVFMKFNKVFYSKVTGNINNSKIVDENFSVRDEGLGAGKTNTFKAGMINLFMRKGSLLEKVGIAMVTKIEGDVGAVFQRLDVSGDGYIDEEEFKTLIGMLGATVNNEEITEALNELDDNKDGQVRSAPIMNCFLSVVVPAFLNLIRNFNKWMKIDLTEFTKWYIKSDMRLKAELRSTFDEFDFDKSGAIDGEKMKKLMKALGTEVKEEDIQLTFQEAHMSGSSDQITFEEFQNWYTQSKYWEDRQTLVDNCAEEITEPISDNLKPPKDGSFIDYISWILLLPIVAVLCLTIPDVRQPGKNKLCFIAFVFSIIWIGTFTYFMVISAEVIGEALGIPMVLMGLTVLAAGTSVPDLLSSIIVARMGEGDMAVSSSIGSNIFDITVGLPVPWLLFHAVYPGEKIMVSYQCKYLEFML